MARTRAGALLAAGVLVLGAGCSSGPSATPTISPGGAPPTAAASGPGPADDVVADDPAPAPSPTWDAAARAAALEHAGAVMTAFARPDLDEQAWWAELAPLLTLSAQDAYSAVDPAQVPPRQVTGEAVLVDETSAWLARVEVPTDVGTYRLLLVREDGTSPWLAEQITPPAALSKPAGQPPTAATTAQAATAQAATAQAATAQAATAEGQGP
ncbi:hypothetical protein [uncultured Pseudokineococcus sp.]|uniref:hypothetical protein n=1 Tax=uncultured Pseudokineococcus sp. TaxID=1642928 RepID=UPI00262E2D53|nr:hypothetical protein [uncultured Pseudokineococcus sp.]